MARAWGGTGDGDETEMRPLLNDDDEAGWSSESNEQLRLIVLGGDDALLDEACGTILGERQNRDALKFGNMLPRKAQVCGRQVSVLKTPSYWLQHLKSYLFFSHGVKSLKKGLQSFESLLFPGPHAFLLVHRDVKNSGREYYLLRALSEVLGKEVLDYCMVLFMDRARHHNPIKNTCLKMCGGRYHILQNTDTSVNELFISIKIMTERKECFFTQHLEFFRKASNYFQEEYEEKEKKIRKALNDSKDQESQLEHKNVKLQEEVELLKDKEKQLQKILTEAKAKEDCLHQRVKELDDRERCLDDRERCLDERERCLDERERCLDDRERCLDEREKKLDDRERCLDDRERCLDEREKQLEIREREVTQRDARSRELHQTTADTANAELKSRDGPFEIQKPLRRNSKEFNPPDML